VLPKLCAPSHVRVLIGFRDMVEYFLSSALGIVGGGGGVDFGCTDWVSCPCRTIRVLQGVPTYQVVMVVVAIQERADQGWT